MRKLWLNCWANRADAPWPVFPAVNPGHSSFCSPSRWGLHSKTLAKQTNKGLGLFKWTKIGNHSFFTLNLIYAGECWYSSRDWYSAYIFGVRWLKWHVAFFIIILDNWLLNQPVTIADFTGKTWTSVILCAGECLITYFGNFILTQEEQQCSTFSPAQQLRLVSGMDCSLLYAVYSSGGVRCIYWLDSCKVCEKRKVLSNELILTKLD